MHRVSDSLVAKCAVLLAISTAAFAQQPPAAPTVSAAFGTQATAQGGANRAVLVVDQSSPESSRLVGTAELEGLEIYDLNGRRLGKVGAGEAVGLDVRSGFLLGGREVSLLAVVDATTNSLRYYAAEAGNVREVSARSVPLGFAAENVCLYRSGMDGALYAFAVGDGGEIDQQMLFVTPDSKVDSRQVRRLHVPSPSEHCVADDAEGQLYVSEQGVGIWRFNADPETDVLPTLIDAPRLGRITEEVGGVALYDGGEGARWLVASDASSGRLFVYDRGKDDAYVGALLVGGVDGRSATTEPGGLFATSNAPDLPGQGVLLVADENAAGGANYKAVPFSSIASALQIAAGTPQQPTRAEPPFPVVRARFETTAVPSAGDAADDPAIWANPADPAQSLIIGTDKKSGLHLYDMQGNVLQHLPDGKMNNVDLRNGFRLGGESIVLVTASDRTRKSIAIYRLDTVAKKLVNVADGVQQTGLSDPYGQCMYRSQRSGKYYVFISDPDGLVRQWELSPTRSGKVRARKVREIKFGTQTEGCVADDETGTLYVAEEDVGLWRTSAEPSGGIAVRSIAAVATNPKLKDDLEGVGLYDLGGGRGYFVVSSQGNNSYAVYRREGDQAYLGSFSVVANAAIGVDGVSETDGLEVTSGNLGPGFEYGAVIAQDGRNVLPSQNQNFKVISWSDIAAVLNLEKRGERPHER